MIMANLPFISLINGDRLKLNQLKHDSENSPAVAKSSQEKVFGEKLVRSKDTFTADKPDNKQYMDLLKGRRIGA